MDQCRFRNGSFGDRLRECGTKGNIINISRQAIINDDLGAFNGLAVALGRAGRRTIESYVYALLAIGFLLSSEIGRLLSHILNTTTQAMDVGALTPPL